MKVLLINPPDRNSLNCSLGKTKTPPLHVFAPPMGLMYIKAYLNKELKADVRLFNFQVPRRPFWEDFKKYLLQFRPDVIGITVNTFFWFDVCELIKRIRSLLPSVLIVGGGAHMATYPEESLVGGDFDIVVLGNGEEVFTQIIRRLYPDRDFSSIKSILYRHNGMIVRTPACDETTRDLDALPFPDRSDIDVGQYCPRENNGIATTVVLTSSGCPFNCAFCPGGNLAYRPRRIDAVIEELSVCKRMGYEGVMFGDAVFAGSKRYATALCQEMISKKLNMPWTCRTRVDCIDSGLVRLMREAGCVLIQMGVESGNQHRLDSIGKKISIPQIHAAFRACREAGVSTGGYFIIGFPGETKEEAEKTFRFAEELDSDYIIFSPLLPFPWTDIFNQAAKDPAYDHDWLKRHIKDPKPRLEVKLWTTAMAESEMITLINRFYSRYYFKPHRIMRHLKQLKSKKDFFIKARTAAHFLIGR